MERTHIAGDGVERARASPGRLAYVAVDEHECRGRILDVLAREGWRVVACPTGFHVLQSIADVVDGASGPLPDLIVVDAVARGLSGISLAAGLRELGLRIPLVLVARPGIVVPASDDPNVLFADPERAPGLVSRLARTLAGRAGPPAQGGENSKRW